MQSETSNHDDASAPAVLLERRGEVGIVLLNQAATRNPLSNALTDAMMSVLDEAERDDDLRALVLTAAGPVFCAGAELGTLLHPDGVDQEMQFRSVRGHSRIVERLHNHDLPVIAAVNGPALGGGAALALACDLAVAAEGASYHFAFGRIGLSAGDMGCAYHLPRIVGTARANYWLFTAAVVSAAEGKEAGLFLDVVPQPRLLEVAVDIARKIAAAAPRRATAMTKLAIGRAADADLQTVLSYEVYTQNYLFTRDDHKERLRTLMSQLKKR